MATKRKQSKKSRAAAAAPVASASAASASDLTSWPHAKGTRVRYWRALPKVGNGFLAVTTSVAFLTDEGPMVRVSREALPVPTAQVQVD